MEKEDPFFLFHRLLKHLEQPCMKKQNTNAQDGQQINMEASGLKRVVVTGMGITSCLGNDLDTVADNLKNAK
jgi:hypothetical protein